LVVIGAGYIGLELGSLWSRLGSEVTVLETMDRIVPASDAEVAQHAKRALEKQGIQFRLGVCVTRARSDQDECLVECEGTESIACDRVLVATGRVPNTDGLRLDAIGIKVDDKGYIPVDDDFATSIANVYAVGDCIGQPMLAHKATEEAVTCVERLVTGYGRINYEAIPAVVYTHPEIASVGRTEEDLQQDDVRYRKGVFPFHANGRAWSLGDPDGMVKILAEQTTDRILGVHIIGPRAGDLIAEAASAIEFSASAEDIARLCHAHPTLAETMKEAALSIHDRSIHA
jgi:dihydrolipoamide dehydrogenase